MDAKLYWFWGITETAAALLLLRGISTWLDAAAFFTAHGLVVWMTYLIFLMLIGSDKLLRERVLTREFSIFLMALCALPLIGPAAILFFILFLYFYPLYPVRSESFNRVNPDVLLVIQKQFEKGVQPVTETILSKGLSMSAAIRMVADINAMEWSATKSSLLKHIIRLCPYQNVALIAIDTLNKKMDALLADIARLESSGHQDPATLQRLAHIYHEIYYLDLCEPRMKQFYQQKACACALAAFKKTDSEDNALLSVRYMLEADQVVAAKGIYDKIRAKGDYFFPRWITYEFELSVRLADKQLFNNLYLLIGTAGGVFIPAKVKAAAHAWKRIQTSAWL